VDKEAEISERSYHFHLVPSNCGILHLVLIAKVLVVLAQLMVKPRGCASLSITSSARTSTDGISASRTTSSAKYRSVKHSLFLPMVVPTTGSALAAASFVVIGLVGRQSYSPLLQLKIDPVRQMGPPYWLAPSRCQRIFINIRCQYGIQKNIYIHPWCQPRCHVRYALCRPCAV